MIVAMHSFPHNSIYVNTINTIQCLAFLSQGGRHFDHIYHESIRGLEKRIETLKKDRYQALLDIEQDALDHKQREDDAANRGDGVRQLGKKAVYKTVDESLTKKVDAEVEASKKRKVSESTTSKKAPKKKVASTPAAEEIVVDAAETVTDDFKPREGASFTVRTVVDGTTFGEVLETENYPSREFGDAKFRARQSNAADPDSVEVQIWCSNTLKKSEFPLMKKGKAVKSKSPKAVKSKSPQRPAVSPEPMDVDFDDDEKSDYRKYDFPKDGVNSKLAKQDRDPWGLSTKEVQKSLKKIKCPPLEMFHWERIVVDEFQYIIDGGNGDRSRVKSIVLGLKSTYRWGLSGTPPHENFADIKMLANLLGVYLGINESMHNKKKGRGSSAAGDERTQLEKFNAMMDVKSVHWHQNRHKHAQKFVDQFLRQNIAEIDEIPLENHVIRIDLPPAEKAIYSELESHLKSLEMDKNKGRVSKKNSTGDKAKRMQEVLEESADAEEALLKRCAHFDLTGESESALGACEKIILRRQQQFDDCVVDLRKNLEAAFTHRLNICKYDVNWQGAAETTGMEVADMLEKFVRRVAEKKGVIGFTDDEINQRLSEVVELAFADSEANPDRLHAPFLLCQFDDKNLKCDDEVIGLSMKARSAAQAALEKSEYDANNQRT